MRIAIFSDVHGNLPALETVLEAYRALQPDFYVCLGDVVGYGAFPQQCCDLVRPLVRYCVIGNHDAAVAGRMDYGYYYDAARTALDYHASQLSPENRDWLRELPYTEFWEDVCFSHGSPIDPEAFDYVFNPSQALGLIPHFEALSRVTFMGHSHLTKSYALSRNDGHTHVEEVTGPVLSIDPEKKYVITVGSVGQPRDNDARACFTMYDTEARTVTFTRLDYDIVRAATAILQTPSLSPDFGKRLYLGI